jgi:hypothetical protein
MMPPLPSLFPAKKTLERENRWSPQACGPVNSLHWHTNSKCWWGTACSLPEKCVQHNLNIDGRRHATSSPHPDTLSFRLRL